MSKQQLTVARGAVGPAPVGPVLVDPAPEQALGPADDLACCAPLTAHSLDEAQAADVAKVFKALGDPVRLRLLSVITSTPGEICVCDLTPGFEVSGPTISHHLKVLRDAGLVDCERRGTWVYYRAMPQRLHELSSLLATPGLAAEPAGPAAPHERA